MNKPISTLIDPPAAPGPHAEQRLPAVANFEACQQCGSPLDRRQRYCVSCGARRGDPSNPASRYFAAASHRRRQGAAVATMRTAPAAQEGSTVRTVAVFFFVLLPIAVAVGVLVGRGGSSNDNAALLAALKQSGATASTSGAAGAATDASATSSNLLPSDFSLDKGYTVMIGSLPIDGTDQAAADSAKADAEKKGAKDVGIINPGDFVTKPDQGQDSYVLYAGEFKSKGDAEKALSGLKKDFPDANVIEVIGAGAGGSASSGSSGGGSADAGQVVAQTSHGQVHQVTGLKPSDQQVQQDTETVNHIAQQTGADYTNQQQQLPDVVSVGGNPDDAPPLPTGAGD